MQEPAFWVITKDKGGLKPPFLYIWIVLLDCAFGL